MKPPVDPVLMFKVLVLQKFHGLSDDAIEEQIFDHTSFKNFLGLRIGDDIPVSKRKRFHPQMTTDAGEKRRFLVLKMPR